MYPFGINGSRTNYTEVSRSQDILSLSYFFSNWCERRDLNPQVHERTTDFKSVVYTNSTTLAKNKGHVRPQRHVLHHNTLLKYTDTTNEVFRC